MSNLATVPDLLGEGDNNEDEVNYVSRLTLQEQLKMITQKKGRQRMMSSLLLCKRCVCVCISTMCICIIVCACVCVCVCVCQ